jgi:hypothetical protein
VADDSKPQWRKSQRSGNGNNCVEVATNFAAQDEVVFVRDSKDPSGPHLRFSLTAWTAFLSDLANDAFGQ